MTGRGRAADGCSRDDARDERPSVFHGRASGGTLLLLALGLAAGFAFQGTRGLYETTEGRYAEVGREMLETGNFLEPTLAYRPHWSKPPATYWMVAGGLAVFGRSAWGARAGNALAFCLTALAVGAIGTTLWRREAGLAAGLIYVSSPLPFIGASVLSADTLLTLWEVLAVLAYVRARAAVVTCSAATAAPETEAAAGKTPTRVASGGKQVRAWVAAMWLCLGLGFFTKGPPALLPLLPVLVLHVRERRPFSLVTLPGLALFAASAGWWYALVMARHQELLRYFIGDEVLARTLTNRFHRNAQWYAPLTLYAPVLVVGQGAWLVVGARLARKRRLLRPLALWEELGRRGTPAAFLLLWLLLPLIVFSIARSRLAGYVLPLFAPLALALAREAVGGAFPAPEGVAAASRDRVVARGVDSDAPRLRGGAWWLRGEAPRLRQVGRIAMASIAILIVIKAASATFAASADMSRLYAAVRAGGALIPVGGNAGGGDSGVSSASAPATGVWLYAEPGLAGLQFYLDGRLRRLSRTGEEPWADGDLGTWLRDGATGPESGRQVLVTAARDARELVASLAAAKVGCRITGTDGWRIFDLLPAPGPCVMETHPAAPRSDS